MFFVGGGGYCVIYKEAGPTGVAVGGATCRHVTASRYEIKFNVI